MTMSSVVLSGLASSNMSLLPPTPTTDMSAGPHLLLPPPSSAGVDLTALMALSSATARVTLAATTAETRRLAGSFLLQHNIAHTVATTAATTSPLTGFYPMSGLSSGRTEHRWRGGHPPTTTAHFANNFTSGGGGETSPAAGRRPARGRCGRGGGGGRRRGPPRYAPDSPGQMVSKQVVDKVGFVFVMILIPCFSLFGSVGNVLSLRVLVHHRMRNSTNMVLAALAVSDLLFLLHAVYFSFLKLYISRNQPGGNQLRVMTFPLLGPYGSVVTARITTGLTTVLSVERLVAVYFPIKAKVMCGRFMTGTCIVLIYIVTALVFIPNALKYHSCYKTVNNHTIFTMELTPLGRDKIFYTVYGNVLNVIFRLIPILLLILVNSLIALAIRRTWSIRRTMSSGGSAAYEQNRITLMLLMVSLVFLVCILPGAVHSIVNQADKEYARFGAQSNIHDVFGNVTYFLETVNSSMNFFIYMAFSRKFCRTYKQIFCCRGRGQARRHPSHPTPRGSARSVIRFPSRPQTGSRSSMTSYRELYFLHHLGGKGLNPHDNATLTAAAAAAGAAMTTAAGAGSARRLLNGSAGAAMLPPGPASRGKEKAGRRKNGFVCTTGTIHEEGGKRIFRSKYSLTDSHSGNSHSGHSGHSHSAGHSHSSHSGGSDGGGGGGGGGGEGVGFHQHSGHNLSPGGAHSGSDREPTADDMYS
ncbi:uncharacterized protein LOC101848059 [Aplysia californica]|uniref:Uncharacterized protein LOC101848059 n=1 Tax=Aplysia californica TaxID=6500 RepID=A0ABM0JYV8_APLCA|nr:uncharacterized protein LOC101848059 [Aplysia californica]